MGAKDFNAQYAMSLDSPEDQIFFPGMFREAEWEADWGTRSVYVMTDTAVSDSDSACQSVIAVILLDFDDVALSIF